MFYDVDLGLNHAVDRTAQSRALQASNQASEARADVKELVRQVERLSLLNQALWELVRDRLSLSDVDLEHLAQEIDMRDGKRDGKITQKAVRCPTCQRVNNTRHKKGIYGSTEFETRAFE